MDGLNGINRMIGSGELLTIVRELNSLVPAKITAIILERAFRAYHGIELPFEKRWIEARLKDGRLLITVSFAESFSTEGVGAWLRIGQLEEESIRDCHLQNASFGLLPITDKDFRGFVHSSREGTRRFIVTSWHEGQRLDSKAKGHYLLIGNTSEDLCDSDA